MRSWILVVCSVITLAHGCSLPKGSTDRAYVSVYVGFQDGRSRIQHEGRWGYIDRDGFEVISPQYVSATAFSEGRARVQTRSGVFVISPEGERLFRVPSERSLLTPFSEGRAAFEQDGKIGYYDGNGTIVIPPTFDPPSIRLVEGRRWELSRLPGRRAGWLRDGRLFIEPGVDGGIRFSEGLARLRLEEQWCYFDRDGSIVLTLDVDYAEGFSEGLALAAEGNRFGFVDREGDWAIPPRFYVARGFSEGLSAVGPQDAKRFGFIDSTGEIVIEARFGGVGDFSEGLAWAYLPDDGRRGFLDDSGAWVIQPRFAYAGDFHEGVAAVKSHGKWGYVDRTGTFVIEPQYWAAGPFQEGRAFVRTSKDRYRYIDRSGRVIWRDR